MSVLRRWLRQPRSLWIRRAIFQVHLWTGIGVGLYVLVVCATGSILVFRPELSVASLPAPVIVAGSGTRLTDEELSERALAKYPGYTVSNVWPGKEPNAAVEILIESQNDRRNRLFDPFTGDDLGDAVTFGMRAVRWLLELHDNLLAGRTGRLVNGVGGILLTTLCLTGAVIWWPGVTSWRRSLVMHRGVNWKRFTWDLHSAVGFWTFAIILMWGLTGFYIVFQEWLAPLFDYIEPYDEVTFEPRRIDEILVWLPRLHFGRFRDLQPGLTLALKIVWVVLGLAPALLFVTGGLMWWNRVIRKGARSLAAGLKEAGEAEGPCSRPSSR